ncbi:hypothetical protein O6H91_18G007100 [Diphasiastrum complanatum]|nr:hypothetical protein O6H91_18G007100 [Diphasiastrum complanatum]
MLQLQRDREPIQSNLKSCDVIKLLKQRRSKAFKTYAYQEKKNHIAKKYRHIPYSYLKPGALAKYRDAQRSARVSYIATRKRSTRSINASVAVEPIVPLNNTEQGTISSDIPSRICTRAFGPACLQRKKLLAPKAAESPVASEYVGITRSDTSTSAQESLLESLPLELLVRIICKLQHDQLRPVFHTCKRLRQSVIIAKQSHFNYTTPGRKRWLFQTIENFPSLASRSNHLPFLSKAQGHKCPAGYPRTPKAPRYAPKPHSRTSIAEMSQITAALFLTSRNLLRQSRPTCPLSLTLRAGSFHRALFNEEELCQAIAQNSL